MYSLTEAASNDIESILERSVIDFGINQTGIYYQSLRKCLELLSVNPEMGKHADDLKEGCRRFSHRSHVIFYQKEVDSILILRVLHKSMDINRQFDE